MPIKNVLLILEDNSVKILSIDAYVEYHMGLITFNKPVKQEIYRDSPPGNLEKRCYISRRGPTETRRMGLSEFPEEIRSLLFLYEI